MEPEVAHRVHVDLGPMLRVRRGSSEGGQGTGAHQNTVEARNPAHC